MTKTRNLRHSHSTWVNRRVVGVMALRPVVHQQQNVYAVASIIKVILVIMCCCVQGLVSECPRLCECKWKNGKEAVTCSNANLTSIPLHLEAGTQVLDLTNNNIVSVSHDEFSTAGLLNLQKVFISKCRLKTIDRFAFRHLTNLVELDLSQNVLSSVPSHAFDSIPELRELKLSGNPIQRIMNDAFVRVSRLIKLDLSRCKIGTIEPRAFFGLESSLEWLYLDNNHLADIRAPALTSLENLHGLELASNPWNCSCSLRPLREWIMRHNVPYGVPPVCRYPSRLATKSWDQLELDEFACAPEIEAPISKAHGVEGRNVTMTCRIGGVPEPNVRWLLKNRVIANLSGIPYNNGKKLYVLHVQDNASNLTILTADVQDAGVYVCTAENKAGRAEASVTLAVSRRPPEGPFSTRVVIASVIVVALFLLASCLTVICICGVRRRRQGQWQSHGQADARRREDSYEKIEMNHKPTTRNDGAGPNNGNGIGPPGGGTCEVSLIGAIRRRGDYRGVPNADTDADGEEEEDAGYEDDMETTPTPTTISSNRDTKHWTTKADPLNSNHWNDTDNTDLHIPRRTTYMDNRDDCKRMPQSTSGTFNNFPRSASGSTLSASNQFDVKSPILTNGLPNVLHPHFMHKQVLENNAGSLYTSLPQDDIATKDLNDKNYPDLLELPSYGQETPTATNNSLEASGNENEMLYDPVYKSKDNMYCTLPKKRGIYQRASALCNQSTDSQSPLLADSRYSSSGGEDNVGCSSSRRLSADSHCQYPLSNRVNQRASSYLNLSTDKSIRNQSLPSSPLLETSQNKHQLSATPLLNVSSLDTRKEYQREPYVYPPSSLGTSSANANTYDYHAAQLERFLEEYRSLQEQLSKMKETCEGIRQQDSNRSTASNNNSSFTDPLFYNNVVVTPSGSDESQPKSILKNKTNTAPVSATLSPLSASVPDTTLTPGDYGEGPPPYWLPRSSLMKRFNFQS